MVAVASSRERIGIVGRFPARGDSSRHFRRSRYHQAMSDDTERQAGVTDPDRPRLATTSPDNEFSLSIEEVGDIYAQAGLARDLRTIQRYCRKGRLEARLVEFAYGEKYLITP